MTPKLRNIIVIFDCCKPSQVVEMSEIVYWHHCGNKVEVEVRCEICRAFRTFEVFHD